jgi:beta-mannosidase
MTNTPRPASSRVALVAGWELARDGAAPEWRAIGAPLPVAALLAEAGEWTIDGPARRFDAERWCYRLRLDASPEILAGGGRLVFDGLATCCELSFNDAPVLSARNMFRRYTLDLPAPAWRASGNELVLRFDALDSLLAQRRPRPRWRAPMVEHQQLRHVRTTLLGRTPGWSPAAAVVGPWRGVWLEPLGDADPEVVEQRAWIEGDAGLLSLAVRIEGGPALVAAVLSLAGAAETPTDTDAREIVWTLERGADGLYRGIGSVPQVRRWWPHTHGEPARYALALRVLPLRAPTRDAKRPFDIRQALAHPLGHVGFRTLAVDRGADGAGFGLRVNGVDVFCRGACWTPLDSLRLHASPSQYRAMLRTLREAGANMIRVGGTMVYEDTAFFAACDEAGVMVWQEFMFANMDYPADDPGFAEEVAVEAAQQLALWQRHASVAVVCGNSEVAQQAAMWGAERESWAPALFHETLARLAAAALPDVPYWPSSASGGAFPFQPSAGTTSYYGVGAYLRPLDDARHSGVRFATEALAFAQVPDDAALARLAALQGGLPVRPHQALWKERVPRDLGAGWDFDDVRDHYLETQFGLPATQARRGEPGAYWALARAATAEAMAAAYTQWRDPASACRGALCWFLRDLRVGAGWGLIDDAGHPKPALHALARVWRPVHLGLVDQGQNGLFVHVVNETARPLSATLVLAFHHRGEVRVGGSEQALTLAAHGSWRESTLAHAPGFLDLDGSYGFGPAVADVVVATLRDTAGAVLAETVCFLRPAGVAPSLTRADIGLRAGARRLGDAAGTVRVTLSSRAAARGVHFESPGWRSADEGFAIAPGGAATVDFTPALGAASAPAWYARASAINAQGWTPVALEEAA